MRYLDNVLANDSHGLLGNIIKHLEYLNTHVGKNWIKADYACYSKVVKFVPFLQYRITSF